MAMTPTDRGGLTRTELDALAWKFLRSEFAAPIHGNWSIDRRLDVFLLHRGYRKLHDDGSAYGALLERVMANLGTAVRIGVLRSPSAGAAS